MRRIVQGWEVRVCATDPRRAAGAYLTGTLILRPHEVPRPRSARGAWPTAYATFRPDTED